MRKKKPILLLLALWTALCWLTAGISQAQELPEPMQPARLVNDFAGMLSPQQRDALEQKLDGFDRETSTQIAVVTVDDLQGLAPSDYAQRLFDKWGVGGRGKDNGVLVLVKPKRGNERGEVFIATGYGLEGAVPDALAGRIVDYDILPAFRQGRYYEGLDKGTSTLMELSRGEYTADQYLQRNRKGGGWLGILLPFGLIFLLSLLLGRRKGYTASSSGRHSGGVPPILFGGFPRSGGGGFGGGFGGFGGFGGGMSGGGGAGGSW